jgi:catechol 2,3-dioxygenase-like lactoylglutathione lyase family enzyme
MFSDRRVLATLPATDMTRAKRWYQEKLELKPSSETVAGAMYEAGGGTVFLLYPSAHAGKAPNTLMGFESTDIEGDVAALKKRGVVFEEYDEGDLKTVNSIATIGNVKGAWFRDSENNILSIGTDPSA